jgi:hypothetical protein
VLLGTGGDTPVAQTVTLSAQSLLGVLYAIWARGLALMLFAPRPAARAA